MPLPQGRAGQVYHPSEIRLRPMLHGYFDFLNNRQFQFFVREKIIGIREPPVPVVSKPAKNYRYLLIKELIIFMREPN